MRSMTLVTRSACVVALVLRANSSLAQADTPVQLSWEAPKNCPQQPEVDQQVRTLVGTAGSEPASPLQAHGIIESLDQHYRLTLFIERGATHGTRTIESEDCKSLGKAAAVVLGLLVQRERTLGRELSESEISGQPEAPAKPVDQPPAPKQAPPPAPPPLPSSPGPSRLWHLLLRAPEGKAGFMTLPRVGYGVGLGVGVAYRTWRAIVTGTMYQSQDQGSTGLQLYQVHYGRKTLEFLGCHGWRSGLVEVAPCAVIAADAVSAHASGDYLVARDQTALWLSVGGGISGYLHLHRYLSLVATGTGLVTTKRARFLVGTVTETEPVHRVPLATLDASLAFEWIF